MNKSKLGDILVLEKFISYEKIINYPVMLLLALIFLGGFVRAAQVLCALEAGAYADNMAFLSVCAASFVSVLVEKFFQVTILLGMLKVLKTSSSASLKELFGAIAVSNTPRIVVGILFMTLSFLVFGFRFDLVYYYDAHTTVQTVFSTIYSLAILISGIWSLGLMIYLNKKIIGIPTSRSIVYTLVSLAGGFVMSSMIL